MLWHLLDSVRIGNLRNSGFIDKSSTLSLSKANFSFCDAKGLFAFIFRILLCKVIVVDAVAVVVIVVVGVVVVVVEILRNKDKQQTTLFYIDVRTKTPLNFKIRSRSIVLLVVLNSQRPHC